MPVKGKTITAAEKEELETLQRRQNNEIDFPQKDADRIKELMQKGRDSYDNKDQYSSSHFDEKNILAHIRMNERTDAEGNRVLFIEELQSDWAQEGRKKGFKNSSLEDKVSELKDEAYALEQEQNKYSESRKIGNGNTPLDWELVITNQEKYDELGEKVKSKLSEAYALEKIIGETPDMPFKKTDQWLNLAMRRVMRYAAENGFDKIAWTTGEQQAERYDLAKQVESITVDQNENGNYDILAVPKGELENKEIASNIPINKVEDYVGKEIAKKVKEEDGGQFSGDDLSVGGEGMKSFYNSIVPKAANKLGKPFGAKVEVSEIEETGQQLSLPVTDKMKQSVMDEGVPMFRVAESQQELDDFVKDSKVKETVYHGTDFIFEEFDKDKIGQGTGNYGHYGYGFYFSNSKKEASHYGDEVKTVKLNIKKPFTGTDEQIEEWAKIKSEILPSKDDMGYTDDSMLKAINEIDPVSAKLFSEIKDKGYTKGWKSFLENNNADNSKIDLNLISDIIDGSENGKAHWLDDDLEAIGINVETLDKKEGYNYLPPMHFLTNLGEYSASRTMTEELKSMGYDGVIYGSEIVAFEPDQVLIEKSEPRFRVAESQAELDEFVKDSEVKETVYHGTTAEFSDFEGGAFFTDDYWNADGYASGERIVEAKIKLNNPMIIDADGKKWDEINNPLGTSTTEIISNVNEEEYDGVVFNNIKDSWIDDVDYQDAGTVYYVFSNDQILIEPTEDVRFRAEDVKLHKTTKASTGSVYETYKVGDVYYKVRYGDHDSNILMANNDLELDIEQLGTDEAKDLINSGALNKANTIIRLDGDKINEDVLGYDSIKRVGGMVELKRTVTEEYTEDELNENYKGNENNINQFKNNKYVTFEDGLWIKEKQETIRIYDNEFYRRFPNVKFDRSDIRFKQEDAREEVNIDPSEAQKEAGNYKMGHLKIDGFDISIENPKGSIRSGEDKDGNKWSNEMPADYGYFKGTVGNDKDHIDVFLGDKPEIDRVYIVDQTNKDGSFDEHKVLMGFGSIGEAKKNYRLSYEKGWKGLGAISTTDKAGLKEWFKDGDMSKPYSENAVEIDEHIRFRQTETPEFKEWFGDSKVVDEDGRPLVVYHGSRKGGFTEFGDGDKQSNAPDGAHFFAKDRAVAHSYSGSYEDALPSLLTISEIDDFIEYNEDEDNYDIIDLGGAVFDTASSKEEALDIINEDLPSFVEYDGGIYDVFLKLENPYEIDFKGASWEGDLYGGYEGYIEADDEYTILQDDEEAEKWLEENGYNPDVEAGVADGLLKKDPWIGHSTNSIAREAMDMGLDGAIIKNVVDDGSYGYGGETDIYIVFNPNQIKSATGNTGAFSKESDDIRFRDASQEEIDRMKALFDKMKKQLEAKQAKKPQFDESKEKRSIPLSAKQATISSDPDLIEERSYNKQSNDKTLYEIREMINKDGLEKVVSDFLSGNIENPLYSNAVGIEIYRRLNNQGRTDEAINVLDKLSEDATLAGQSVQILSLLTRMNPEGQIIYIKKQIDKANDAIKEHNDKSTVNKIKPIEITEEEYGDMKEDLDEIHKLSISQEALDDIEMINNLDLRFKGIESIEDLKQFIIDNSEVKGINKKRATKLINDLDLELDWLKARAVATVYNKAYGKIPETVGQKISTYQAISHLLNPKTFLRNIISNKTLRGLERATRRLGAGIDGMLAKSLGTERVIGKKQTKEQRKTTKEAAKIKGDETSLDILLGVNKQMNELDKYRNETGRWSVPKLEELRGKTNTFKGDVMGAAEKMLTESLVKPDEASKEKVRQEYLNEYKNLTGLEPDAEIIEEANQMAKYMTFQDDSWMSDFLIKSKVWLNTVGINGFGLGDLVIKYTKVPGNVIARTFDYSPIGLIKALAGLKGLADAKKKGEITREQQMKVAMGLSRGISGSAILALGFIIKSMGIGVGDDEENKAVEGLIREAGLSGDKLNLSAIIRAIGGDDTELQKGDILANYDWLQPIGSLLKAGGTLAEDRPLGESMADAMFGLSEIPSLYTIKKMADAAVYGDETGASKFGAIMSVPFVEGVGGFVPAPVRQVSNIIDPVARDTYSDGNALERAGMKVAANIPGLRQQLKPRIRPTGEDKSYSTGSIVGDIISQINPSTIYKYSPSVDVDKLSKLSEYVSPTTRAHTPLRFAPKTLIVKGQKIKLDKDQKERYMKAYGAYIDEKYNEYLNGVDVDDLSDRQADKIISKLRDINKRAKSIAKREI